ncbi:22644_t:CDS:2, partial [Racocetra persica]
MSQLSAGKSTLGNLLLDQPHDNGPFIVSDSVYSCTQLCAESEVTIDGQKFNIVDTPGIFDTNRPDEEVYKEIAKIVQKCVYGIKAILFVFEAKRFTEEQKNVLDGIRMFFGEGALNYIIAVFSRATKKQNADKNEMRQAWNPAISSFIGSIGNRWGISPDSDYFPPEHEKHQVQEKIQREKQENEKQIRTQYEENLRREGKEKADREFQEQMNRMHNEFEQKQNDSIVEIIKAVAGLITA